MSANLPLINSEDDFVYLLVIWDQVEISRCVLSNMDYLIGSLVQVWVVPVYILCLF